MPRRVPIYFYYTRTDNYFSNDVKRIKTYAIDSYQDTQLKLLKKRSQEYLYKWRFHGELSPTRILSIRAMEGYLSPEEPRFGNRFMAHILVKFDTEQVSITLFILNPNNIFTFSRVLKFTTEKDILFTPTNQKMTMVRRPG